MDQNLGTVVTTLFAVAIAFVVGWVIPVMLGIQTAARKHYSPHWMWFGIHPVGGWIAFIVLSCLPPRAECQHCGGYVSAQFRLCPYCRHNMERSSYAPDERDLTDNKMALG